MILERDIRYAAKLRALRKKYNIIQYTMASELNLKNQQEYSDYEKGKKHFPDVLVMKICTFFRIPILDFIQEPLKKYGHDFIQEKDHSEISNAKTTEIKLLLYKKLYIEAKMESVVEKLKLLQPTINFRSDNSCQSKIRVMI
jgi:transcriptional regulator with XRE-family HTH domain